MVELPWSADSNIGGVAYSVRQPRRFRSVGGRLMRRDRSDPPTIGHALSVVCAASTNPAIHYLVAQS